MRKAIFLDRDGTINEEVNYLKRVQDIKIFPNTLKALQKFKSLGFLNIIVTNQSGIARGYLSENDLNKIHKRFRILLRLNNEELIDDIFYSPYHIDGTVEEYKCESEDRKPNIGMISKATSKFEINLKESFLIGDSFTDMKCAENAGLKKILVKTGYGKTDYKKCKKENINIDYYAEDLFDASIYLEKLEKPEKPIFKEQKFL
jgi:D,D-heptose 1,7-bisphosphate phosphatase